METNTPFLKVVTIAFSLLCLLGCSQGIRHIRQLRRENTQLLNSSLSWSVLLERNDSLETYLRALAPEGYDKKALVCCVDNSCSVCIGDFCLFAKSMKNVRDLVIIALVDAGTFKTFQYYTDKVLGEDAGCFQAIPVNSLDYYFVLLNLPEGAQSFLLSNGSIVESFRISDGRLFHVH